MNSFLHQAAWALMMCWIVGMPLASFAAQPVPAPSATNAVSILTLEGKKEEISVSRSGSDVWDPAYVGQVLKPGDRGRTGSSSRLTLRFSDLSVMRIAEGGSFTIQAPPQADQTHSISLWKGLLYLFHRDKPGSTQINSRTATAATRGTEFTVEVNETSGTMLLSVLAGEGELSNSLGSVTVKPGEQGESVSGVLPRLAPRIDTHRIIQWVLYYPGILSTSELSLSAVDRDRLQPSLTAYDSGDLTAALQRLPAETAQPSPDERVYRAALLVALGQVSKAEGLLTELVAVPAGGVEAKLAQALLRMVQGVRNPAELSRVTESTVERTLATEWIGASYERQAQLNLNDAVESARRATQIDPASGYAWARLAELEFGMGRTRDAERAVQTALKRSPNNAQAHALTGLLRANRGALQEARMAFDEAIRLDGALSTGWLGRGLLKIRAGEVAAGREDLQVAAAMEPQRGVLRSYLAKAWHHQGELKHARKELELARELDPNDPTAALYSALLHLDQNEFNQAIRDLQESKQLNDNRAVYRSRLLLDQDKAVRGANLAAAYEDAGLRELGVSEASRAISSDYANYSSHLFLANIYNDLRDPHQINQRYETPWLSEYLVANLLAPVGAGVLSQAVSQQEYSRFFERDGFGVVSSTEYQSRGDWIQSAAQYGRFGRMSYAIEGSYRSEKGQRANEEFTSRYVNLQFKQELTTQDSLYFQASTFDTDAGDLTPYYNPAQAIGRLRARERSAPSLLMGYHREWSPGSHTLFLAGRLNDAVRQRNPQFTTFTTTTGGSGPIALPTEVDAQYTSDINLYTGELQHILERNHHTWVMGLRGQAGEINARSEFFGTAILNGFPLSPDPGPPVEISSDFVRLTTYLYDHWQFSPSWLAVAGVTLDHLRSPINHRFAPLTRGEESANQLSPKLGLVWTPTHRTTARAALSRSLGGVGFDQSFQLEPSQVAGFNQAFRSIIPESVANANAGAEFRMAALSLDHQLSSNTWAGISFSWLTSDLDRTVGIFDNDNPLIPLSTRQHIEYQERSLTAYLYQLIDQQWSVGLRYRLSDADIQLSHLDLRASAFSTSAFPATSTQALLHQTTLFTQFQHPGGFFARGEATWYRQQNQDYRPAIPGDDFWQFNLYAGYRFPKRRAEIQLGILNLTSQDYRLNSLNLSEVLPRERTFAASLKFNF